MIAGSAPFLAIAAAALIPPPPDRSATDCAAPVYVVDGTVCTNPDLLAADLRMQALLPTAAGASSLVEDQQAWLRRRNACAFQAAQPSCLADAYAERNAVLGSIGRPMTEGLRNVRCMTAPWSGAVRVQVAGREVRLTDASGRVRAVAFSELFASGWRPFLSASRTRRTITFRSSGWRGTCSFSRDE